MKKYVLIFILFITSLSFIITNTQCKYIIENNINAYTLNIKEKNIWNIGKTTNDNVYARLEENGNLMIYGVGEMKDFTYAGVPWYSIKDSIKSVDIKYGVINIGNFVFSDCSNLTSISIANSIKKINYGAFLYTNSIEEITLPESIEYIGISAFYGCRSLKYVYGLENTSLTTLETAIFYECSSLIEVTLPNTLVTIGQGAFQSCSSLKFVYGLENIPITTLEEQVFFECSSLIEIALPNTLEIIGSNAFSGCSSLTELILPNGLKRILQNAFYGCYSIREIIIPNSVEYIGGFAFDWNEEQIIYCEFESKPSTWDNNWLNGTANVIWLSRTWNISKTANDNVYASFYNDNTLKIYGVGEMRDYTYAGVPWYSIKNSIVNVNIEYGVTNIGDYAFSECINLTSLNISNSVKRIGSGAFCYFIDTSSIEVINLPRSIEHIGMFAFYGCNSLKYVYGLENTSLTTLEDGAFFECSNLVEVKLPNTLTSMGNSGIGVFEGCTLLKYVYGLENTTIATLGQQAFLDCTSLIYVKLPNTLEVIGSNAFSGCSSLTEMILPSSLKRILQNSFLGCYNIEELIIPNSVEYIGGYVFNWKNTQTIYCEFESRPSIWDNSWCNGDVNIVWLNSK